MRTDPSSHRYEVIVVGGGHAGTEAAWAAAAVLGGGRVALVTMDPSRIGQMSCNPAIGGLGKGQIVREIDALGGLMGLAIDETGILFKMLNTSKGPAVRGPRAQADKYAYRTAIQRRLLERPSIEVIAGTVDELLVEGDRVVGVRLPAGAGRVAVVGDGRTAIDPGDPAGPPSPVFAASPTDADRVAEPLVLRARAVVLTTGTFMRGLMHTGEQRTAGGRVTEGSAEGISATLRGLGFELGRLKTGTPPRLRRGSIDWDGLDRQSADEHPVPFSDRSPEALPDGRFPHLSSTECRITRTTPAMHGRIRANLHRAPMFSGQIDAECGPRYCPSIEDKVVRFADRDAHHVFLEPESLHTDEVYCNGISTSLPTDVQAELIAAMPGCERAEVLRWGYAVEYDMVWPHQIDATTMTRRIEGLLLAGQINCTTGYEEAGGQGLVAGLNAARLVRGEPLVRLGREQAYIGVMMDDLVTKPPREPYRMFTSRAEHRLLLRADTADERLTPLGRSLGLIDDDRWRAWEARSEQLETIRRLVETTREGPKRLSDLARRPEATAEALAERLGGAFPLGLVERVFNDVRYEGYVRRQQAEIRRQSDADRRAIPGWLDYRTVTGLRSEAVESLERHRPATFGQAGRLPGVNPADLTVLAVALRRGDTPATAGPAG